MVPPEYATFERVESTLEGFRHSITSFPLLREHATSHKPKLLGRTQKLDQDDFIREVVDVHELLQDEPYSLILRLRLAQCYYALGYPDLAAGEAYKLLLLVDEVADQSGEYHGGALDAIKEYISSLTGKVRCTEVHSHYQTDLGLGRDEDDDVPNDFDVEDAEAQTWAEHYFSVAAYENPIFVLLVDWPTTQMRGVVELMIF